MQIAFIEICQDPGNLDVLHCLSKNWYPTEDQEKNIYTDIARTPLNYVNRNRKDLLENRNRNLQVTEMN